MHVRPGGSLSGTTSDVGPAALSEPSSLRLSTCWSLDRDAHRRRARRRAYGVAAVETLASLASQAAIAIENDRLQRQLRELAVRGERERIAREMHDGLAQVLAYVNTKSQAVEELLAAGRVDGGARPAGGARRPRRAPSYVDVREAILGLYQPDRHRSADWSGAVEEYGAGSRRRRSSVTVGRRRAMQHGALVSRRRRGAGLPHRPGGADERPQAREAPRIACGQRRYLRRSRRRPGCGSDDNGRGQHVRGATARPTGRSYGLEPCVSGQRASAAGAMDSGATTA